MAEKLLGKSVTTSINERIMNGVEALAAQGVVPKLAIVRIGGNESDMAYERGAVKRCETLGVAYEKFLLSIDVTTEEVVELIEKINKDNTSHGCLFFRPLPKHLDAEKIENTL